MNIAFVSLLLAAQAASAPPGPVSAQPAPPAAACAKPLGTAVLATDPKALQAIGLTRDQIVILLARDFGCFDEIVAEDALDGRVAGWRVTVALEPVAMTAGGAQTQSPVLTVENLLLRRPATRGFGIAKSVTRPPRRTDKRRFELPVAPPRDDASTGVAQARRSFAVAKMAAARARQFSYAASPSAEAMWVAFSTISANAQ